MRDIAQAVLGFAIRQEIPPQAVEVSILWPEARPGEGYYIEEVNRAYFNLFPSEQADYSQLHTTIADAVAYRFAGANGNICNS